jgi:hypothetical protein
MSSTLAEPTAPSQSTAPATRPSRVGVLLAVQVLALGFVLASFPVRNADFWTHLAVGRAIAGGTYRFGVDPLAYTTTGVYWANHSWLFDVLLYHAHAALGDGVVLLKAAFVAAVAAVMLLVRRPGSGLVVPSLTTALALLAMAPRLLLQSALASVGLLAVTVLLLLRPPRARAVYALPAVAALWVNLDGWFWLGPLAVFLVWLGERWGTPPADRRVPGWLVLATVAACLLSPHHVRAFVLPAEVSPAVLRSPLADDPRFRHVFEHAWHWRRYADPAEGLNGGGIGFLALLAVSGASFLVNRPAVRGPRFLLWLGFTLLGLWNVRLAAFFAVVAGPVAALNWQDYLAGGPERLPARRRPLTRAAGFVAAAVPGLALLALCWAGWVQAPRSDARKVGWAVQPDPGLRRSAEERARWRADGWLAADDRAFHTHPDSAAYAAWFAPGERCFLDHRLRLFAGVAGEYRALCAAAGVGAMPDEPFPGPAGSILRDRGITYVVLHDPDPARLEPSFFQLDQPAAGAKLLQISGREATFGLPAARGGRPFAEWALDPNTAGFRAADDAGRLPAPAPAGGIDREPEPRPGWRKLLAAWEHPLQPPPVRPAETGTAGLYLRAFHDEVLFGTADAAQAPPLTLAAGLAVGAPPLAGTRPAVPAFLAAARDPIWFAPPGRASPSAALLAVRAARAAVAADPDDPVAHFRLGQAYVALSYATREHEWAADLRPLAQLRHVQTVSALERAVALDPDLFEAHALLTQAYSDRGMLDAAAAHLREQARIAADRLRRGRADREVAARVVEAAAAADARVQERRNEFLVRAPGLSLNPVGRARTALGLGLTKAALDDVLLASDVIQFGTEGARLELELLLMLGRTDRLRQELASDELRRQQDRLGMVELPGQRRPDRPPVYRLPAYDWVRFLAAAGDGNYDEADRLLGAMDAALGAEAEAQARGAAAAAAGLTAAGVGLAGRPEAWPLAAALADQRNRALAFREANRIDAQVRADLRTLAGVLALERGEVGRAERHFRAALGLADGPDLRGHGFAAEPVCRAYLWRIESARTGK